MWKEMFVMGCWCWEHNSGTRLFIILRKQFDVQLNYDIKTSRDTFEEAKKVVDRYIQEKP